MYLCVIYDYQGREAPFVITRKLEFPKVTFARSVSPYHSFYLPFCSITVTMKLALKMLIDVEILWLWYGSQDENEEEEKEEEDISNTCLDLCVAEIDGKPRLTGRSKILVRKSFLKFVRKLRILFSSGCEWFSSTLMVEVSKYGRPMVIYIEEVYSETFKYIEKLYTRLQQGEDGLDEKEDQHQEHCGNVLHYLLQDETSWSSQYVRLKGMTQGAILSRIGSWDRMCTCRTMKTGKIFSSASPFILAEPNTESRKYAYLRA